jgi:hypothetical protein
VLPLPATLEIEAPEIPPPFVNAKSPESTPDTLSLKVTVNVTLAALVGLETARFTDTTVGAVLLTGVCVGVGDGGGVAVGDGGGVEVGDGGGVGVGDEGGGEPPLSDIAPVA